MNTGEKDYSATVSKIKAVGAEYPTWGGLHTRRRPRSSATMRDQGSRTVVISGDGITEQTEFASIGGPGVEGTFMSFGPDPRNNASAKEMVAAYRASGYEPAQAYTL